MKIHEFLHQFGIETPWNPNEILLIRNKHYLLTAACQDLLKTIKKPAISASTYLGIDKTKTFEPSLWLLNYLACASAQKIVVNEKSAWLFVCGRDVLRESVLEGQWQRDQAVLVINEQGDCLGWGHWQESGKTAVKRQYDIGDFLRRERH